MKHLLTQIRPESDAHTTVQQKAAWVMGVMLLGATLGLLAKFFDNTPMIGLIGTYLGFWIFVATVIAAWSRSPLAAALHVFSFFVAMLVAYYAYSMILFGTFNRYYFLAWVTASLISPLCAVIAWYARGNGWPAALCASLPIALLLTEGYPFIYTRSIPLGFDILAAAGLFMLLTTNTAQKLRVLLLSGLAFYLFRTLDVVSRLFGTI